METGPKICLPVDKRNTIWFIFRTVKSEDSEVCSRCYLSEDGLIFYCAALKVKGASEGSDYFFFFLRLILKGFIFIFWSLFLFFFK